MSAVHLTLAGEWMQCAQSAHCSLPYHVPEITVEEARALPAPFLDALIEIIDPPEYDASGHKIWRHPETTRLHRDYGLPAMILKHGNRLWYQNGQQHNLIGPAVVYPNGRTEWWHHGRKHRDDDLPSVRSPSGTLEWWTEGELQRDGDNPAVVHTDGKQEWWQQSKRHRDNDLPAIIAADGTLEWYWQGNQHREEDKPAYLRADGSAIWYRHGQIHRGDGKPAAISMTPDGQLRYAEWWEDGKLVASRHYPPSK